MKLTKEDYMRLPKERLAELLAEMDSTPIEPIVIPSQPAPSDPSKNPYPFGPIITYTDSPNTNDTKGAADRFVQERFYAAGHPGWNWETRDVSDAFKAGAEWAMMRDEGGGRNL